MRYAVAIRHPGNSNSMDSAIQSFIGCPCKFLTSTKMDGTSPERNAEWWFDTEEEAEKLATRLEEFKTIVSTMKVARLSTYEPNERERFHQESKE